MRFEKFIKLIKHTSGKYITFIIFSLVSFSLWSQSLVRSEVKKVVIDPGHGGKDPGAVGTFTKEKDIVLSVALKLGDLIKKAHPDVKVIFTRETDEFLELYQRANIANKAKADLFISIHANSAKTKEASGLEFFVLGPHKSEANLDVAKRENAVVNLESNIAENYGFDPNSPDGHIIMTMKQSLYMDNSIQLAKKMEASFEGDEKQFMRGVKQAGFVVLYQTTMPSCLVEVGFISNPAEEEYIASEEGQRIIADKLSKAFTEYKNKVEKKTSISTEKSKEDSTTSDIRTSTIKSEKTKQSEPIYEESMVEPIKNSKDAATIKASELASKPIASKEISIPVNSEINFNFNDKKEEIITKKIELDRKKEGLPPLSSNITTKKNIDTPIYKIKTLDRKKMVIEKSDEIVNNYSDTQKIDTDIQKDLVFEKKENVTAEKTIKSNEIDINLPRKKPIIVLDEDVKTEIQKEANSHFNLGNELNKFDIDFKNIPNVKPTPSSESSPKRNTQVEQKAAQKGLAVVKQNNLSEEKNTTTSVSNANNSNEVIYYTQLFAGGHLLDKSHKIFSDFSSVVVRHEDNMYKYLIGETKDIENAKNLRQKAIQRGYSDAFIVKYLNGKRIK